MNNVNEKKYLVDKLVDGTIELLEAVNFEKDKANLNTGTLFVTLLSGGRYKVSYMDEDGTIADVEGSFRK